MSDKWTKAQIETAKKYLIKGCDKINCSKCLLQKDKIKHSGCLLIITPTRANLLPFEKNFKLVMQQHEHDADEPEEQSNPLNDPKMEWINLPTNMSVHDYWRYQFAGMAMQGLLADSKYNANAYETAEDSIKFSDALLKQLEEKK